MTTPSPGPGVGAPDADHAKEIARRLRRALTERGIELSHSATLELTATAYGIKDWNTLAAAPRAAARTADDPRHERVIPILRMFDRDKAHDFYVGYLGWTIEWEHRFEDRLPLYVQVSSPDGARLHLSEHHGDGTPGSAVIISVADVERLHADLTAKDYPNARPGLEDEPWGRTVTVHDPFGNRITFLEPGEDEVSDDRGISSPRRRR